MNGAQIDIITITIALVFALIGFGLLSFRRKKKSLFFLGISFLMAAGISLFIRWAELREILVALAAVIAAFTAAISIDETKRLRQESVDRERRDRTERLLDEIIDWAIKVVSWRSENRAVLKEMASIKEGEVRQSLRLMHAHIAEVQVFFTAITGLNEYISKLSLKFQQGLPEVIQKLISDLKASTDFIGAWQGRLFADIERGRVDVDVSEDSDKADKLAQQFEKSAGAVLEKAADIKAKEIG